MQLRDKKMDFSTFVLMIYRLLIFKDSYLSNILEGKRPKGWSSKDLTESAVRIRVSNIVAARLDKL